MTTGISTSAVLPLLLPCSTCCPASVPTCFIFMTISPLLSGPGHPRANMREMRLLAGIVVIACLSLSRVNAVAESHSRLVHCSSFVNPVVGENSAQLSGKGSIATAEESARSCAQRTCQRGRLFRKAGTVDDEEYDDSCGEQFLAAMEIGADHHLFLHNFSVLIEGIGDSGTKEC
jgi:hypothetical protein